MADVQYIIELTIAEGKEAEFASKAAAYSAATKDAEPGTLGYNWYRAENGATCVLHERFETSEALLTHLGNVGPSLPELLAIAPITRFEVLGAVSDEARATLDTLGVAHFKHLAGFTR